MDNVLPIFFPTLYTCINHRKCDIFGICRRLRLIKKDPKKKGALSVNNIMPNFQPNFGRILVFTLCLYCDIFYERYTKKCLLFLGAQQHPNTVTPSSSPNTPSRRQPSRIPRSPNRSRPTTPSISRPPSSGSRPVTPSFSQSAETINIYINYNEPDQEWFYSLLFCIKAGFFSYL